MASQASQPTDRSSAVVGSGASVQLAAANKGRQYLFVQNISDVAVYVKFGGDATTVAGSVYLAANGGSLIFEGNQYVPSTSVNVIAATGSNKGVTCFEA